MSILLEYALRFSMNASRRNNMKEWSSNIGAYNESGKICSDLSRWQYVPVCNVDPF